MPAERKILKKAGSDLGDVDDKLNDIVKIRYSLTMTAIEKFVKGNAGYLMDGFNSQFAQVLADRALETIEKVLYCKSKKVRFNILRFLAASRRCS